MRKQMMQISVTADEGRVFLTQVDPQGNDDMVILLAPEQVSIVAKWLREAANNALQKAE